MKIEDFKTKSLIIKTAFKDTRKLKHPDHRIENQLEDEIFDKGDIFQTEDENYIFLTAQIKDFDEESLVKYCEIAEKLYEIVRKPVSIYILCSKDTDVCVKECEIKSEADFKIKLAKNTADPAEEILNFIKRKIAHHEVLDNEDLEVLEMLPVICNKEKRNYYRLEYFKIINRTHY